MDQNTKENMTEENMTEEKDRSSHDEGGTIFVSKKYKLTKGHKGIIIVIVVVALILLGEYLMIKQSPKNQTSFPNPFSKPIPNLQAQVTITDKGFIPATILVKKGTQVTFLSQDNKSHQIASDPHPLHTGLPGFIQEKASSSFSYTFNKTGTFTYHDEINPLKFHGTIIVE